MKHLRKVPYEKISAKYYTRILKILSIAKKFILKFLALLIIIHRTSEKKFQWKNKLLKFVNHLVKRAIARGWTPAKFAPLRFT